jgi:hypothetical protein
MEGARALAAPSLSPSILGAPEAPLLPAEDDDDDDDDDDEDMWESSQTTREEVPRAPLSWGRVASPSPIRTATAKRVCGGGGVGAHSPTLLARARISAGRAGTLALDGAATGVRLVRVKDRVVQMKRAPCKRASRAARPSEPSANAVQVCANIVRRREGELKGEGRSKLAPDDVVRYRTNTVAVSGRGPSAHAQREEEQAKINHIAQLKAKNVETHNQAASWLLCGNTAEQCYDQLAESALRSNAVNSAITKKKDKQGANYQTTRIWCKGIGAAAAAQCGNVAIALGLAEAMMRARGIDVRNPLATNAADPCVFAEASWMREDEGGLVGVVSTTQLVFNANPTKVGVCCIMSAARKLANLEMGPRRTISEAMASSNYMLSAMCKSVGGGYEIDAAWASIVLIVYCTSDPRGRPLLREHTSLTDLDIHTACTLEAYGRGEVTRRARLRASQGAEASLTEAKPKGGSSPIAPAKPQVQTPELAALSSRLAKAATYAPCDADLGIEDDTASVVNDDDELEDDPLSTETADQRVLATKRKRASKGYASASTADSHGVLTWLDLPLPPPSRPPRPPTLPRTLPPPHLKRGHRWYKALRCKDKSVLETLVAYTKSGAREAAQSTLETQAEGTSIADSRVIAGMSVDNALRSSAALHPFINRTARDAPRLVAISVRESTRPTPYDAWEPGVAIGWVRSPNAARSSALHACSRPPVASHPPVASGMGVLWSVAVQELCPRRAQTKTAPGVLERHALVAQLRTSEVRTSGVFRGGLTAPGARSVGTLERHIASETSRPLPSAGGGVTRSFLGMKTALTVHEHTWSVARVLADEAAALHATTLHAAKSSKRGAEAQTSQVLGESCQVAERLEPYCTPAPRLSKGLQMNELLRRCMQYRTRKNDPCKLLLGVHSNAEVAREMPAVMDSEPMPLATITDFDLRIPKSVGEMRGQGIPDHVPAPRVQTIPASLSLHVCLDSAIRAPDMIASLDEVHSEAHSKIHMQRALLYVGSSQASFISESGTSICAAAANANINSSKKISCADMNTLALLSIWDVWAGGVSNVQRSFPGTAYSGAYGPTVSTGLTSVGLMGHFFRSDGRGHGSHTLSQECADEVAAMLADRAHFVRVGAKKYALTPVACRGIPHGFVPGVHSVLDDLLDGLRVGYQVAGKGPSELGWTKTGLFSLPFSGVTQALRPDVESTADSTLRYCFREPAEVSCATGRSYLPDATHEEEAVFTEPLWRRPCQASVGDNPFATSYEYADSVWNVMNALAVIAERVGGVTKLREHIDDFHYTNGHTASQGAGDGCFLWAADACVLLFGAIYPRCHAIAQPVVPECYAKAHGFLNRSSNPKHSKEGEDVFGQPLYYCVPGDPKSGEGKRLYDQGVNIWKRFTTRAAELCPWRVGVAPMLELLLKHKGSHHLTREDIGALRERVNALASRAAWLAYSEDGVRPPAAPHPLAECATANDVRRPHLDPVFCAQGEELEIEPRGCLVGLKPFQLRQLYALLLGSDLLPHANLNPSHPGVQVVRNEGGLLLRESALPTILEMDGSKRSCKGVSYTQTESDQPAYGSRKAKVYGASLQMEAWDSNTRILAPLFCAISEPQTREWRACGEFGDPSWLRTYLEEQAVARGTPQDDEVWARRKLEAAAASDLASRAVHA